jgi:hypothetical protein
MHASNQNVSNRTRISLAGLLACLGVIFGLPAEADAASGFADVERNTHADNIAALAERGVTKGCNSAGTLYCPSDSVTRGQMATFIVRSLQERGVPIPENAPDAFEDDDGSTHEANINALAAMGVVKGGTDGRYRPNEPVNRAQMASFLQRGFELTEVEGNRFSDVSGTHMVAINTIAAAGVTLGCDAEGTKYCPAQDVRRDQMASFLMRAIDLPLKPGTLPDGVVPDAAELPALPSTEMTSQSETSGGFSAAVGGSCGSVGLRHGAFIDFRDDGIYPLWGRQMQYVGVLHWLYPVPFNGTVDQGRWHAVGWNVFAVYAPNPYYTTHSTVVGGNRYSVPKNHHTAAYSQVMVYDGQRYHHHPASSFLTFGASSSYWCTNGWH